MTAKLKLLNNHQGFMKYFKNTSWIFGERFFRMFVGFFVGVWVARYLGPEQLGLFSYVQSFVGLFTAFTTLGLDGIVVRELVKDKSIPEELIGTTFLLKLMGAFGVIILLAIIVSLTSYDDLTNLLVFIIAGSTIFQSFNVVDIYFQSKVMSKYIVYSNVISLFISSIIKVTLILNEAPLVSFAWVVLFDSFVLAIGYIYFYLKKKHFSIIGKLKFNRVLAVCLLRDSWPLIFNGIVISVYLKFDQIMLQSMIGNEAVGLYSVALRLSEVWYFIPIVIASSLFPAIINAKATDENIYYQRLQKLFDFMFWVAIMIALPISIFSEDIINILYGKAFNMAGMVLAIHIWTTLFIFLGLPRSKWFISENLQRYALYAGLIGVIVNILLNYILIPIYSIYGAAFATLISSVIGSYLYNLFNSRLMIIFKLQTNAILLPFRKLGLKFNVHKK